MSENYRVVLVIGNGFDLDLGLRTTYSDFMSSCCFLDSDFLNPYILSKIRSKISGVNLFSYLDKKYRYERWIDLENELANWAVNQKKAKKKQQVWSIKHINIYKNLCVLT